MFKHKTKAPRRVNLTPRQAFWIKTIAVVFLLAIVAAGFYVSFGTLVAFAMMFGKAGEAAVIVALIIDALAVLGLGITLTFPTPASKTAFLGGVGASASFNLVIGFSVAGPVGALVAVIPQLSMILGEKVVFDLLLPVELEDTTSVKETTTSELEDRGDDLVVLEDYQEPEVVFVEDLQDDFWVIPDTVEDPQEEAEVHQETAPVKVEVPMGFTRYSKDQVVSILQDRGEAPGRPTIMKEFGVSDWTARQIVTELKNN